MDHITEYLICTICLDIIENDVIIKFGHTFYNVCITMTIDSKINVHLIIILLILMIFALIIC